MRRKLHIKPEVIQKFSWGGNTKQWEEEAEKLSNQLETMEIINNIIEKQDCENKK